MITFNVRILGLDQVQRKLGYSVLVEPEIQAALETFRKRIMDRPGKGIGAARNTMMSSPLPLGLTVESTLAYPRQSGKSWGRKNTSIIRAMAPRVIKKAVQRIEERWGS
jgi:hypothetical protein